MRPYSILFLLFFSACNSKKGDSTAPSTSITDSTSKSLNNDTLIISERIDGPANIRDTVNGKLLFTLNNNVVVTTTDPQNKWLQVGVFIDLSKEQMDSLSINKGSKIFVGGNKVGQAIEKVHLQGAFTAKEGLKGELVGYTSISNIKANTIPENVFSGIVNESSGPLTLENFKPFLKNFEFQEFEGLLEQFKGFEIDENWIDDPSPLMRLWLLFEGDKLYGVFHSRQMNLKRSKTVRMERGFYLSILDTQDKKTFNKLFRKFNSSINQVD